MLLIFFNIEIYLNNKLLNIGIILIKINSLVWFMCLISVNATAVDNNFYYFYLFKL